jgi:hypoxanthine phosphoribosyltransferase
MHKTLRIIHTEEDIEQRINQLAAEISASAPSGELTVVGILDDAFVFLADLIRAVDIPLSCCFMKVTKHRHDGQTEIVYTSEFDPYDRDILLVGGLVSTGVTFEYVTRQLAARGVRSLRTCALVDKQEERRVDIKPDYAAFQLGEGYVFGYGLGLQNQFRQLPYLAMMGD